MQRIGALDLSLSKQQIAGMYDKRADTYDENPFQPSICKRVLHHARCSPGHNLLDIGTGTGHIAFAVAEALGPDGSVLGVDISPKMLDKAESKLQASGLKNVRFMLADAEALDTKEECPLEHFDRILCANTFPWMENKPETLKSWLSLLKPGGVLVCHTPAAKTHIGAVVLESVFQKYGVRIDARSAYPGTASTSIQDYTKLFSDAGFTAVEVIDEPDTRYTSVDKVLGMWNLVVNVPMSFQGLEQLSIADVSAAKADFNREVLALSTESGILEDMTALFIVACKSGTSG